MRELRIHHFFDIIRDYGAGKVLEPHEYGHSYHTIGEEIYSNSLEDVRLIVRNDDICQGCRHLDSGICLDTIGHRADFSSKQEFNDYLDRRIMKAMGYRDGQDIRVRQIIEDADAYLDSIFEIYEGNDPEHTEMRKKNVALGISQKKQELLQGGEEGDAMNEERIRLETHVDELMGKYSHLSEEICSLKLSRDKWSVKEIFGHLIDSAANNYQRFVRLQENDGLDFPAYDYNWVNLIKYNSYPFGQIMALWKQYNLLLCHIIGNVDASALDHCWVVGGDRLSLRFLISDYIDHMELHIRHLEERLAEIRRESGHDGEND